MVDNDGSSILFFIEYKFPILVSGVSYKRIRQLNAVDKEKIIMP